MKTPDTQNAAILILQKASFICTKRRLCYNIYKYLKEQTIEFDICKRINSCCRQREQNEWKYQQKLPYA